MKLTIFTNFSFFTLLLINFHYPPDISLLIVKGFNDQHSNLLFIKKVFHFQFSDYLLSLSITMIHLESLREFLICQLKALLIPQSLQLAMVIAA